MRKLFCLFLSLAMVAAVLTGCGSGSTDKTPTSAGSSAAASSSSSSSSSSTPVEVKTKVTSTDKITIRVAYDVAESHPSHKATVEKFKAMLEQGSNGNITVELYPNSQLGSLAENMESMRIGDLEMAYLNDGTISASVPEFSVVGLPYLWTSIDAAHEALDGDFGEYLSQKLLDTCNIINLGYADVGFRNITNSKKEVKTPDDLKGLKIRTMTNPLHVEYFTALGAIPTPMSFSELFTALQQKTVDGQENPTALIYNNGIYEVQKYMTITEHVWTSCPMCIAADFFNSLPSDYQELIKEAAAATISYQRELITQQNADLASKIEEAGVKVTTLTDEEKAAFKKVAEGSVYKTAAKDYGQDLIDMAAAHNK